MHRRQLELAEPCAQDWAEMKGTSTVRHCTNCSKSVFNLSMLTEREANAALAVRPRKVCVIYYVDAEDRVVFHPEAEPSRWSSPHRTLVAAVAASAIAACSQPAVVDREASPVAIANSETESPAGPDQAPRTANTPAASSLAPVDAGSTASSTPTSAKEACDPRWEDAFKEKGRGAQHVRYAIPKPGGLRSKPAEAEDLVLNPYEKGRLPVPEPAPEGVLDGPNQSDLAARAIEAMAAVRATCEGAGVAAAVIEIAGRSGRVTDVQVSGVEPASAACVEKAVRRIVKVPKFRSKVFLTKVFFRLKD